VVREFSPVMKRRRRWFPAENGRVLFGEVAGATAASATTIDGGATGPAPDIDGQSGSPESLSTLDRQERSMMFLVA